MKRHHALLSHHCDNLSVLLLVLCALPLLTSCNVTRTVTTRSEAWQHGDTSIVIQTKTVESYDGPRTQPSSHPPASSPAPDTPRHPLRGGGRE